MLRKIAFAVLLLMLPLLSIAQTTSNALPLTIQVPQVTAVLTSLAPSTINAGAQSTITIVGTGFVSGSTAFVGSTAVATTFVSATQLTCVVPATLAVVPTGQSKTTVSVTVQNPVPVATVPKVLLQWQASITPNISGYLVRRDGTLLTSNPLASLSFDDIGVPSGTHSWAVTAVQGGVESDPATVSLAL